MFASGPPSISITPTGPIYLREGERLYLECVAEGDPAPTVQWLSPSGRPVRGQAAPVQPGTEGLAEETTALVSITGVTTEDSGTYQCIASNSAGRTTEQISVRGQ